MGTPHNEANPGEIAETILLPGDPLRAKRIAETMLTDARQFNDVRNMLGFTGFWAGKRVSVMGTGMGMPSIAIYAHELITVYGVKNLIRIGSAGSLQDGVNVRDIVFAQGASTDSNFGKQFGVEGQIAALPNFNLLRKAVETAETLGLKHHVGNVLSSDVFYHFDPENWRKWQKLGILAVEMEANALYLTAAQLGANALAILTVSDSLVSGGSLSQDERQNTFAEMVKVALSVVD